MRPVMKAWARPVALGVIRVDDEMLVFQGHDEVKNEVYYRPLGGTIEFGEHSEAAIRRELREELNVTVVAARLLGVIENAFTFERGPRHEIDFVYAISVTEIERLRGEAIAAVEADGSPITCLWKPLAAFEGGERLYPPGLLPMLR